MRPMAFRRVGSYRDRWRGGQAMVDKVIGSDRAARTLRASDRGTDLSLCRSVRRVGHIDRGLSDRRVQVRLKAFESILLLRQTTFVFQRPLRNT